MGAGLTRDVDLDALRAVNESTRLDVADMAADPLEQFRSWWEAVRTAGLHEPDAMVLCTVATDGRPTGRHVLLRGLDQAGFVFYTNYTSDKAVALDTSGQGALVFGWHQVRWQVRVEGPVARVSETESDAYFATRPRGSQLGAWASDQSAIVASRAELDGLAAAAEARFAGRDVPRPSQWGGYRLAPERMEFWLGHPDRLHDRIRYRRHEGRWLIERLAP